MTELATKRGNGQLAQAELTHDKPLYVPRFDIWETDDELTLCGDLPQSVNTPLHSSSPTSSSSSSERR